MSESRQTQTVDEFAQRLGCHPWTLRRMVQQGTSPVPPIRVGRKILFAQAAIDRLLSGEGGEPAETGASS